jgi:nucleoside-diphosphate-sugar epimerase
VVFGASGIIGRNLAERLASSGSWEVVSVARHAHNDLPGSRPISDAKSAQICRLAW